MYEKLLKELQKKYSIDKEKANFLLGKIKIAKKTYKTISTDFLTLNEQEFLKEISFENNIFVLFQGDEIFERKVALISPDEVSGDFPTKGVKISGNFKFEKVTHRDYLGSILGLGLKREKIGDINIYEDGAEIVVHNDVLDYILFNLKKIKHTTVKICKIDIDSMRKKSQEFKEININISSSRFDSILSGIFNISRTKSSAFIKSGSAKINNIPVQDTSKIVKENSIITLKGYGKAKVGDFLSTTKKGRQIVSIYKYI